VARRGGFFSEALYCGCEECKGFCMARGVVVAYGETPFRCLGDVWVCGAKHEGWSRAQAANFDSALFLDLC